MQAINTPELVRQIGLEELSEMGKEEIATDFMPASIAGLSDGDLAVLHPPYSGNRAELYGEGQYNEGRVAQAMLQAALKNGMNPGLIYDFQTFASGYFTDVKNPLSNRNIESTVRIHPEAVTIDGNPIALARVPALIADYGACLTGRSYIDDQAAFLNRHIRPFAYSPLTRLHFTNQSLINTYNTKFGQGGARTFIDNQLYIGREDGVAAATDEIIRAQRAHGASAEVADIILCTGAQHTSKNDLKRGVENAHTLLREAGMLIIRSLTRPAAGEVGTEEVTGWALNAGFQERDIIRYEANIESMGALLLSGHFGEREIQTFVLTK